jgi:hypothetical protein
MLNSVTVHTNRVPQQRAQDAEVLKQSGAHKLVVADRDGNCLAFVLAWDSFDYDAETDTYVCIADSDGRELMTMYTAGEIKSAPGTNPADVEPCIPSDLTDTPPSGYSGRAPHDRQCPAGNVRLDGSRDRPKGR